MTHSKEILIEYLEDFIKTSKDVWVDAHKSEVILDLVKTDEFACKEFLSLFKDKLDNFVRKKKQ
jgi:hypothetical protein